MFPIRDNVQSRTYPVVNWAIIAVCALVFFQQLAEDPTEPTLVERYGMIPARITHPGEQIDILDHKVVRTPRGLEMVEFRRPAVPSAVPPLATLVTCIFLHGGWMHFLGNMWFLWIFGDNVEDRYGHVAYLAFYLLTGVAASLSHLYSTPDSIIPTIGASGAIAAVMGAYLLSYPHARVLAVVPIFIIVHMVVLPAPVFLIVWFLIQFIQGSAAVTGAETTGVAWWAHIGGFVAGMIVTWVLGKAHFLRPTSQNLRLPADGPSHYRVSSTRRHF